eukprot:scaffold44313_cov31-Attheya_sp.AAC.1
MELGINEALITTPTTPTTMTTTTTPTPSKSGNTTKKRKHVTFVDADETMQDASPKDEKNDGEETRSVSLSPEPALVPSNEQTQALPGTQPPIPGNGQLDESRLFLGPIDKFAGVSHR